ncbi:hypothetical protein ACFP3U_25755 [Kitasatospora misakiensis]|uniref:Helix-turn-helix domain-containing protein n=1 Tax=Kitasatospora misakiensis TaxID=67330 RepID=A0ABW0XB89_9ACTN
MADSSPQGRGAIRKALKELTDAGYYRVEKIRMPDGTIRTETHVYDTPWSAPDDTRPAPGGAAAGRAGSPLGKNRRKEPSLPARSADDGKPEEREEASEAADEVREAVATLFRVIRPEPRLRLGEAEAAELAPLVAQWLQRGAAHADLAQALLPGLPVPMHSAAALLRYRLEHKMPPAQPARPAARPTARYAECAKCHDPVPRPGICRPCAGLTTRTPTPGQGADIATAGAARARTALRSAMTGSRPAHIAA